MFYTGPLLVEPNAFTFQVKRMSVRHDAIGLDCSGIVAETRHHWAFDATAFRQPEGHFLANKWAEVDGENYETNIYLIRVKQSRDDCEIEGFWYERVVGYDPVVWRFSGSLNPF